MSSPHQSVPPAKSSHTPAAGSETGSSPEPTEPKQTAQVIRITQMAYLGVVVLLFCVFFAFVGWPIGLWWLLLLPVAAAVWIERTRTTVSEVGLDLRTVFGSRHLDWAQVAGVGIPKRGFVRAHLTDDTEVKLPAVSYDRLRDLIRASNGRIPDLFAAEAAAREAEYAAREAEAEGREAETKTAETNGRSDATQTDTEAPAETEVRTADTEARGAETKQTGTNGRDSETNTETKPSAAETEARDSDS
ncbi:PH domain-containing protein [Nocardia vinacea]|uniref:PH domain-containing protein n=1 Tax=Nocardia vinacea TaxID=96468 RepID=UPI0002EEFD9A|nr:PH domain-containing protein [Nocardia vinacea]